MEGVQRGYGVRWTRYGRYEYQVGTKWVPGVGTKGVQSGYQGKVGNEGVQRGYGGSMEGVPKAMWVESGYQVGTKGKVDTKWLYIYIYIYPHGTHLPPTFPLVPNWYPPGTHLVPPPYPLHTPSVPPC